MAATARRPLTPAQQALAAEPAHLSMAAAAARCYSRRAPWLYEELRSAALHGLVVAAGRFDASRGVKFTSYLWHYLRGYVLDEWRRQNRELPVGPPPRTLPSGEGPVGWEEESLDVVRGMIRRLPDAQRETLWLLYACAGTSRQCEVARVRGVAVGTVCQQRAAALVKLKKGLRHD